MTYWPADLFNPPPLPLPTPVRIDRRLGAHLGKVGGQHGTRFAVVAPHATAVTVIGPFNGWDPRATPMRRTSDGVWEGFVPDVGPASLYKFHVQHGGGRGVDKADPVAFATETPPGTASRVWDLSRYRWTDAEWMATRELRNRPDAPVSIYEVHLGSWMRGPHGHPLTYRELADRLADYVRALGFTHVELLPVAEHPFGGSWGYQTLAYYAPTSRYGSPDDFMYLVDTLHRAGVGVILDWVPGHFPADPHGLAQFDGTPLYEHRDPRQRHHPDWHTLVFDFGTDVVTDFLTSSALFWLDRYHVDGVRVDAVASMLYLDYSRRSGEWTPNADGGHENLDAVRFLRSLTHRLRDAFPDTLIMAEESTAWPRVTHAAGDGGLGFDVKWNMGWMHDVLGHLSVSPQGRSADRDRLTASLDYAFTERFVLPLSHDEVVHGKGSLFARMPGDDREKLANLRLLYGWMFGHPGKKLLFMGNELGQPDEWRHDQSLDWHLLDRPLHRGLQRWVGDLNRLYRQEAALHAMENEPGTLAWTDRGLACPGVLSFLRSGPTETAPLLFVCNFSARTLIDHHVGVPVPGRWVECLNSDGAAYGGRDLGNLGGSDAAPTPVGRWPATLRLTVPPTSTLVLSPKAIP